MFVVRNDNGDIVTIATRREDAEVHLRTNLDKTEYTIEEVTNDLGSSGTIQSGQS